MAALLLILMLAGVSASVLAEEISSDGSSLRVGTTVEPGATVYGAGSFVVPVAATDVLSVLVVEPFRYTEHLFTDVEDLLGPR